MNAPSSKFLSNALTVGVLEFLHGQSALSEEALHDLSSGEGELFDSLQNLINEILAEYPIDEMKEVYLSRERARETETKRHHPEVMPEYLIKLHEKVDELQKIGVGQPWKEVGLYNNTELKETHPNSLNLLAEDQTAKERFKAEHRTIWPIVKRERALDRLGPQVILTGLACSLLPDPMLLFEDRPDESDDVAFAKEQFRSYEALRHQALPTKRKPSP